MACVFNNGWWYIIPPRTALFQVLYNGYNLILTCRYNGHTTWVTLHITRWRPRIWWNIFRQIGSNIHKKWIEAFCNAFFIITYRVIDIEPRTWQIILIFITLWDRKRTQWATWGLIRTKKDSFWVGRLKWSHRWSQMVSFWVAVRKLLPLGAKLVSFWMVGNHRVSNRFTWSQLVLFWVAYRKAPPQRTKMVSFWVVWFPWG